MAANKKRPAEMLQIPAPGTEHGELKAIGGSQSDNFNHVIINQAISTLWLAHSDEAIRKQQMQGVVAAMIGVKPDDELEGMLAAQLVAAHNAAMECYRRAMIGEQSFEGRHEALNQATKLVRSYAVLVEALDRHRGKGGQQRVTVEHVHVHQGGQAIVGAVTQGGGASARLEDPAYAPRAIEHEPGAPLPCPDTARDAVPFDRDPE